MLSNKLFSESGHKVSTVERELESYYITLTCLFFILCITPEEKGFWLIGIQEVIKNIHAL
jgi:hypothetical protein